MKAERPKFHPGPFRTMKVDAEFAGIPVAVGFFVMGFVSVPIAKGFLVGAFLIGIGVAVTLALLRRMKDSRPSRARIFDLGEKPTTKA